MLKIIPNWMIWVPWPEKSPGDQSEITEDLIREIALPLRPVDIKICALAK